MLKIGIIVSSTRPTRWADVPTEWIKDVAGKRGDMEVEVLDLRDYDLPFFDEMASNAWMPSENENAVRWQKKLAEFDGYIFITAEYNRSITGALKNAIDQAYVEWNRKPAGYVGYGAVGASRAIEQLRLINVELQLVPTRSAVHIGGGDFMKVHPLGGQSAPMSEIEDHLLPSANDMLDQLAWLGNALKAARDADANKAQAAE